MKNNNRREEFVIVNDCVCVETNDGFVPIHTEESRHFYKVMTDCNPYTGEREVDFEDEIVW